jgi:hypothetical protein
VRLQQRLDLLRRPWEDRAPQHQELTILQVLDESEDYLADRSEFRVQMLIDGRPDDENDHLRIRDGAPLGGKR